jgi:hypothetical protein
VTAEVIVEQRAWDGFFWFTDRVSKKTGQPILRLTSYGGRPMHDHRDDPMKMRLEERVRQASQKFWFRRNSERDDGRDD